MSKITVLLGLFAFFGLFVVFSNFAFAVQENTISDTKSDFPESIKVEEKTSFSLKMSNLGEIRISDIEPIITIMPKSASKFVHVEINPQISTLWDGFYQNTNGTIYVDKEIPVDRIFVSVSFMGKNPFGEQVSLSSDSTFNASIKIEKAPVQSNESIFDYSDKVKYRIVSKTSESDIFYNIHGGIVEKITILSDGSLQINTAMKQDGTLLLDIPKKTWFLANELCEPVGTVVLVYGKEYSTLDNIDNNSKQYGYSEKFTNWGRTVEIKLHSNAKEIEFAVVDLLTNIPTSWQLGQKCLAMSKIGSPLKQFKSGIPLTEIRCNEGLTLLKKTSNDAPICVSIKTGQKMLERKLANPTISGLSLEPVPKSESDSEYTEMKVAQKLLSQNQIKYIPDKLVVTSGPVTGGDPRCGAVINVNSTTHWFAIDSISNPQKLRFFSENPHPCQVNTASCFCNAQMELTALTLDNLSYFSPEEEEEVASMLIDYLVKENINRTPKFMIGKFNINYTNPSAIGYCGELWGYNTIDYFDGAIVNDQVADYGLAKELSPLCAISEDAKWWE